MYQKITEDNSWQLTYEKLYKQARYLVYALDVSSWCGQEYDVAWDITQESICRTLEYTKRTAEPIRSMDHLLSVVAQHYGKDLRRRECRHIRPAENQELEALIPESEEQLSFGEQAIENVHQECLFQSLAQEIAHFPKKQRQALLCDLANRMSFEDQPTPLQAAFLRCGIHLEAYRMPSLPTQRERERHTSLLSYAYRRLARLAQEKHWTS